MGSHEAYIRGALAGIAGARLLCKRIANFKNETFPGFGGTTGKNAQKLSARLHLSLYAAC